VYLIARGSAVGRLQSWQGQEPTLGQANRHIVAWVSCRAAHRMMHCQACHCHIPIAYVKSRSSLWCWLAFALLQPCAAARGAMPRPKGCTAYSEKIKQEICDKVRHLADPLWRLKYEKASAAERSKMFKRGRAGDPLLTKAFNAFKATKFSNADLKKEQARITRKKFGSLVRTWLHRHNGSREALRCTRTRKEPVTAAEYKEAATILATPKHKDGGVHYYRSVRNAIDVSPHGQRLETIFLRSKLSERVFSDHLLKKCPDILKWGRLDLRDKLPAATLEERRRAADVWSGRRPWLTIVHRNARLFDADLDNVAEKNVNKRYIYWNQHGWDIFWYFTFIIDATTVDNCKGQAQIKTSGFVPANVVYPPEDVPAGAPATSSNHVMFYCIMHPYIGLVSGPWIMHNGSTKTNTKKNSPNRHVDTFPTWCVRSCDLTCHFWSCWSCRLCNATLWLAP
jgi:hypothetical protein